MRDKIYIKIAIGAKVHFRIKEGDKAKIELASFNNNYLVNPLYYNNVSGGEDILIALFHDDCLVQTDFLLFEVYDHKTDFPEIEYGDYYAKFFRYLRWVTEDVKINGFISFQIGQVEENVELEKLAINSKIKVDQMVNMNIFSNLISLKHIAEVDAFIVDDTEINMYEEILLDAKEGLIKSDYRKVIMYSTIAIESALRFEIEKKHSRRIESDKHHYILVTYDTSSGPITKDEIYSILKKRNSFDLLLHEMPMYVMNKSIKLEDEKLYKNLKTLYKTRNKLVHQGMIPDDDLYLQSNALGGILAYRYAIRVFHWLGIDKYDHFAPDYYRKYSELS